MSLLSLFICFFIGNLAESQHPQTPSIDWLGTFSLIASVAGFCFTISQGDYFGWTSTVTITSILVTVIMLAILVYDIKTHPYPVVPKNLLNNHAFILSSVVYITTISVTWVVAFYTPLYLRIIAGFTIAQSSLWFSIMTTLTVLMPVVAGYVYGNYSKKWMTHISIVTSFIGLLLFTFFTTQTAGLATGHIICFNRLCLGSRQWYCDAHWFAIH